jgi:hypothetical protein
MAFPEGPTGSCPLPLQLLGTATGSHFRGGSHQPGDVQRPGHPSRPRNSLATSSVDGGGWPWPPHTLTPSCWLSSHLAQGPGQSELSPDVSSGGLCLMSLSPFCPCHEPGVRTPLAFLTSVPDGWEGLSFEAQLSPSRKGWDPHGESGGAHPRQVTANGWPDGRGRPRVPGPAGPRPSLGGLAGLTPPRWPLVGSSILMP